MLWTPVTEDLGIWLDGQDTDSLKFGASGFVNWTDKSGRGHITTGPAGPSLGSINGHRAAFFSGSQRLTFTHHNDFSIIPNSGIAYFGIISPASYVTNKGWIGKWNGGLEWYGIHSSGGSFFTGYRSGGSSVSRSTAHNNVISARLHVGIMAPTSARLRLDGVDFGTTSGATANNATTAPLAVGSYSSAAGVELHGSIGEVLILRGIPPIELIEKIEGYLAHRWDASSILPENHPFKTSPPTTISMGLFGTTRDKNGNIASRRVIVIRESTGKIVNDIMSDPMTGNYEIPTPYSGEPYTIIFRDEPERNALIYAGVMPEETP